MRKKAYTLIELLSVIVILAVIGAVAVPKVIDLISMSKLSAYNTAKVNIVDSAKLKYLADVNTSKITEYTIDDLIDAGYLKNDTKNPLTNEKYENTKVLITNEDGNIKYDYIEGNTLYDIILEKNETDGLYKQNDSYLYKGSNPNNYISFNGEIYRIIKIDSYRNVYLLKDIINQNINKNDIEQYKITYYNDNYLEKVKEDIISLDILDYQDYINSFDGSETYINNDVSIWVKKDNEYKSLQYDEITNDTSSNISFVLKLKNSTIIESGNGTQINPYILK